MRSGARRAALMALVAGLFLSPVAAAAQTECELESSREFRAVETNIGTVTYFSRPRFLCLDGARIRADSAQVFSARSFSQFYGNVEFEDSTTLLNTDRADFFTQEGRLHARGAVVLTNRSDGSTITGDTLLYLRETATRPQARITVTGDRPHARLYPAPAASDSLEEERSAVDSTTADSTRTPGRRGAEVGMAADSTPAATPERTHEPVGIPSDTALVEPEDTVRVPYDVDADRIFLEGNRYFRATGNVVVTRDSLEAFADSVVYDQRAGRLFLTGSARVLGGAFELTGRDITMVLPGDEPREVIARRDAVLTGQGLRVESPVIHLFMEGGSLARMVAIMPRDGGAFRGEASDVAAAEPPGRQPVPGRGVRAPGSRGGAAAPRPDPPAAWSEAPDSGAQAQPRAVADDFVLTGDSIEALTPGEELERVLAAGSARGESTGRDSLNTEDTPEVARRDWLEGDTILAFFVQDTAAAAEGGAAPAGDAASPGNRMDRIVARGSARSLYRLASRSESADSAAAGEEEGEGTPGAPERMALHFVQGAVITIHMEDDEVRRMEVEGQTRGLYLEPVRRRPPPAIQARPAPSDTAAATGSARRGGGP